MAENAVKRPGRNEPCHCGSGKKYKQCCLVKDEEVDRAAREQQTGAAEPTAPPEEAPSQRTPPPPRVQGQPWKRTNQTARGPRRITTPRKAG